ncbi:heavy metal-responsive transcriptional regulator [sulfur-oxidizing endosymbiont of Gigantopelta aegis]|uniref:heavy metal-responsive transcriptional regulator n=1 Tax=sulfur-oxidizing endosymbiont of Gigantopelta aegis TaxID=2794934 RepID=UPI0018DCDC08|nr:heavy metal-responsive transcriptional regulator [sulfur-oxidizing endosymbiont of Gigantopelta aegis]
MKQASTQNCIGDVSQLLGLSTDTLRYYEKSGLLPRIARNDSGRRIYDEMDISKLRFIIRAKKMNFSLAEISDLLKMRQKPQHVKDDIRFLTRQKLTEIESHIDELSHLKNELTLLLNLCQSSEDGCPIIDKLDEL